VRLLAVETSTPSASVALADDDRLIRCDDLAPGRPQTELLMGAIDRLLRECHTPLSALDGFAVAVGPGAFIGLRVGIATVKGLAMGSGKPVVAIPTLEALAARAWEWESAVSVQPMICPMIDARRGEVYAARYRPDGIGGMVREGDEQLVRPEEFLSEITGPALFLGNGALLHRALIMEKLGRAALFPPAKHPELVAELMAPSAAAVARLAWRRWQEGGAVDPAELTAVHLRPAVMPPPAPEISRA